MNQLNGTIVTIESSDKSSLVDVNVHDDVFSSIVLETPQSAAYLKVGQTITLLFKETEVAIAKNLSGMISMRNRIPSMIKAIDSSKILTKVTLDYKGTDIVSIISTRSAQRMALQKGDHVEWLVKTNEVSLMET